MAMYYRSVGHGAVLLLNNTPDRTGLIPEADARRSAEFGAEVRRRFGKPLAEARGGTHELGVRLRPPAVVNHAVSMEDLAGGERIRQYVIEGLSGGTWIQLGGGSAIGHKKIDTFPPAEVEAVRLRVTASVGPPSLRRLTVYRVPE
jgi:alpha-L-fucosidase